MINLTSRRAAFYDQIADRNLPLILLAFVTRPNELTVLGLVRAPLVHWLQAGPPGKDCGRIAPNHHTLLPLPDSDCAKADARIEAFPQE